MLAFLFGLSVSVKSSIRISNGSLVIGFSDAALRDLRSVAERVMQDGFNPLPSPAALNKRLRRLRSFFGEGWGRLVILCS